MMWNLIDMIDILDIETILEKQTSTAKTFVTYKTKKKYYLYVYKSKLRYQNKWNKKISNIIKI